MTSASELFYRRRSRVDRNDDTESGFGSSSLDRNPHHNHTGHRRSRIHHLRIRGDVEDSDPVRRSPHSRHLCHREQESGRLDYGAIQSSAGNSGNNGSSSSRANRVQIPHNNQLPGAVLLARERLVERLRGVSLNGNRQSSRVSVGSWDEFAYGDNSRLVDAGDWETETMGEWLAGATPLTDSSTQTDLSSPPDFNKRPPGLSREEVNALQLEVFDTKERDDPSGLVTDCSICLDRFEDDDILIRLPCQHKFHSACIDPWVQICGDCPNCRAGIIFDCHRTLK